MATQRKSRKSPRKTNESTLWIVVVVVLAFLLIWSLISNITRVDVGTVQNDLASLQAQLTAQAAITEAPATEAPDAATEVVETDAPKATVTPTEPSAQAQACHVIHESVLVESMDHVSTSGDFIHVEYWFDGQPERETILDAAKADGGAYTFSRPLKGWVWEYDGCTYDEVLAQVNANITRRLAGHFNNVGYFPYGAVLSGSDANAPWDPTKLFVPAH